MSLFLKQVGIIWNLSNVHGDPIGFLDTDEWVCKCPRGFHLQCFCVNPIRQLLVSQTTSSCRFVNMQPPNLLFSKVWNKKFAKSFYVYLEHLPPSRFVATITVMSSTPWPTFPAHRCGAHFPPFFWASDGDGPTKATWNLPNDLLLLRP